LAAGPARRDTGIETSNADAYRHFTRGMMAAVRRSSPGGRPTSTTREDSGFVEAIRARQSVAVGLGDANGVHRLARSCATRIVSGSSGSPTKLNVDRRGRGLRRAELSARRTTSRQVPQNSHATLSDAEGFPELVLIAREVAGDDRTPRCLAPVGPAREGVVAEASARRVALQPDLPVMAQSSATLAAVGNRRKRLQVPRRRTIEKRLAAGLRENVPPLAATTSWTRCARGGMVIRFCRRQCATSASW
jgi:hypothetical protein